MRTAILYNFLLEANLMASIAIVLMMLLRKTLRKPIGNAALKFGWLLIAIRLLLPLSLPNPLIYLIRTPYAPDEAIRPIAGQIKVRLSDLFDSLSWGQSAPLLKKTMSNLYMGMYTAQLPITLAKIYLAGVVAVIVWFVIANVRFRQRMNAGRIERLSGRMEEQFLKLCEEIKVKPLPVYYVDPLPSACLVGVFRPYIALPLTVSPNNAIHVLRHEVCHFKNLDHVWGIVRLLCCSLHWFNPLVWAAAHMSHTDSELHCDDAVARSLKPEEKQAYAGTLVLSASRRMAPGIAVLATGMTQTHKKLKTRVKTILESKKPLKALSVSFMLLASMALIGAFATEEVRVSPRLAPFTGSLGFRAVTKNQEALDHGKTLMSLPEFGLPENEDEDLRYEVATQEYAKDEYLVSAGPKDQDVAYQSVSFDNMGRLLFFVNYRSPFEKARATEEFRLSEKEVENLAEDLKVFLRTVNPEEAMRADSFYIAGKGVAENSRFVTFIFRDSSKNMENGGLDVLSVVLEVQPRVRIVKLLIYISNLGGNG